MILYFGYLMEKPFTKQMLRAEDTPFEPNGEHLRGRSGFCPGRCVMIEDDSFSCSAGTKNDSLVVKTLHRAAPVALCWFRYRLESR